MKALSYWEPRRGFKNKYTLQTRHMVRIHSMHGMHSMHNQDNLPYLPNEILELIISYIEDVDTRRYFGVYTKLKKERYNAVRTVIPLTRYFKWQCRNTCSIGCENHKFSFNFNPLLTPVLSQGNYIYIDPEKDIGFDGCSIERGNYTKYSITYTLPNLVKRNEINNNDIMDVDILVFENYVIYEFGIWRIKRKTGEKEKETKCMYYLGEFDNELDKENYFTDYLTYSYKLH
jgi:hypothetical protein